MEPLKTKKPRVGKSPPSHRNVFHRDWSRAMYQSELSQVPSKQVFHNLALESQWNAREEEVRNFEKEQRKKERRQQRKNWKNSDSLFNSSKFTQNVWPTSQEAKQEKMKIHTQPKKRKLDENSENSGEYQKENKCRNCIGKNKNRKFKKAKRKLFLFPENDFMEVDP